MRDEVKEEITGKELLLSAEVGGGDGRKKSLVKNY
jgi:hypothetical protein